MGLTFALLLSAASFADLDALDREIARFSAAEAMPLDRRLKLRPCAAPLALSWRGAARDTVVVACPDLGSWKLYVPLRSAPAAAVPAASAAPAPVVSRGDAVTIAVNGPGFSVSQPGEALEAGPVGAWIRVRAAAVGGRPAAQPIRARVIRPGLVGLPLD